jgi:hypothetical protein
MSSLHHSPVRSECAQKCSGVPLCFPGLQNREVLKCRLFISTAASLSMCSGVPLRFPSLQNKERFKNVVFAFPTPSPFRSACARGCYFASLVCRIQRFINVIFASPTQPPLRSACAWGYRYASLV